jgi:hypothetical protein
VAEDDPDDLRTGSGGFVPGAVTRSGQALGSTGGTRVGSGLVRRDRQSLYGVGVGVTDAWKHTQEKT